MDRCPPACPLTSGHSGGSGVRLGEHRKLLTSPWQSLSLGDLPGSSQTSRCFLDFRGCEQGDGSVK